MAALETYVTEVQEMVMQGMSHKDIAISLGRRYQIDRGCSERSVRRLCSDHNIKKDIICDAELQFKVSSAIEQVGPTYGRRMMTGFLATQGTTVSEVRVGRALREVHRPYHERRQNGARKLNPIPYRAEYFGHKLHCDQNEKLVMFGLTHVAAIDGYSGKVVTWASMPVKNNLIIYEEMYRKAVSEFGLWDQIRVDHGTEFYLLLYIQELNQHLRNKPQIPPYIQTTSTKNHRIERMWSEVNNRINFPLKAALVDLLNRDVIDMDDNVTKYCISNIIVKIGNMALTRFFNTWNVHRIPGKGIPNQLAELTRGIVYTSDIVLPTANEAAEMYRNDCGSTLTRHSSFGSDHFHTDGDKEICEMDFNIQFPDLLELLGETCNENYGPFQNAILYLIAKVKSV